MIHTIMKTGLNPIAEKQINDNFRNLQREAENKGLQKVQSTIYLEVVNPSSTTENPANYMNNKRIFFNRNSKTTISVTSYCWSRSEYYDCLIYVNDNYINRGISFTPDSGDGKRIDIIEADITQYIRENEFNKITFYFRNRISFDVEVSATIINE